MERKITIIFESKDIFAVHDSESRIISYFFKGEEFDEMVHQICL